MICKTSNWRNYHSKHA